MLYHYGELAQHDVSLLALAVAVGIVIDDAIVVLESIYRRNEEGFRGTEAAERERRSIVVFALLASTSSLIVIFLPVLFLKGPIGTFFGVFSLSPDDLRIAISYPGICFLHTHALRQADQEPRGRGTPFMRAYGSFEDWPSTGLLRWALGPQALM
ncbi:MAG: efflux RND transporter permease subunit [Aquificota bacterium]|nr:efflux RND transporter permease subunit [Aquificota bacterium]